VSRIQAFLKTGFLAAVAAGTVFSGFAFGGDDTTPPELKSLRFSPNEIQTGAGSAEVVLSFILTDDASGVNYFEAVFVDPSGVDHRSASLKFNPARSVSDSTKITFPRFSNAGEWELSRVFVGDASGNTLSLDTDALRRGGFPTTLTVKSVKDTVSPKLTALSFTPAEIDTSKGADVVKVNYTATDDVSGVSYFEVSFASPSGTFKNVSAKFEPAESVSNSLAVTFPARSEAGQWTLSAVFLADAAGNTLILKAEDLAVLGFPTALHVKSATDTKSPELTSIRLSPEAIDTSQGEVIVTLEFKATDDFSGVKSIEAVFTSPSSMTGPRGLALFSPARLEVSDSVKITFPKSSEAGAWTLSTLVLSDEAGNTLILSPDVLAAKVGVLQVR
jgi:hypothetical protein